MKKINLFLSTLIIALVVLVAGGATIAPAMQLKAMSLNTAADSSATVTELFDSKGRYQISKDNLTYDKTYNFFGYDWHLVMVNGNVATFWMADPYAETYFNKTTRSGNIIYKDAANVWVNGYTKTVWNSVNYTGSEDVVISESAIRTYLTNAAKTIIDSNDYANYKDKVLAGYIDGNNQDNATAKQVVKNMKYALTELTDTMVDPEENQITAYYNLETTDRLWLPSISDLRVWGIINDTDEVVKPNMVRWTETTISNAAWLRNAEENNSNYVVIVSYNGEFSARSIENQAGVRPAIHLNITDIDTEYQEHANDASANGNSKGNWIFNEDWLKALFLTVCILGIVGVILVIVAVVIRNRKASGNDGADNTVDDDDEE